MDIGARIQDLVASGDRDGAATIAIEALGPGVLGYLRAIHGDGDDASDVFQLWAEDLWRGVCDLRSATGVRAWAFRLAFHASARFRREVWRLRRTRLATTAASRIAGAVAGSTPIGRRDERLEVLARDLSPDDQTLLLLRLDLEMSWDDIAEVLSKEGADLTPTVLRKRYQRLKERLGALAREKGLLG